MFTFIETVLFTKLVGEYLSDEEYGRLQQALIGDPEAGAVVKGPAVSEKLDGPRRVVENVAGIGLFISYAEPKTKFGCSPCIQRT